MKGLVLVGGYGTRLRPLTLSVPKPLIQFCNKPIIEYQIRALVKVGVKHVILAVAYQPDAMKDALRRLERKYNIRISCSIEDQPLLTAGPIKLAEELLMRDEVGEVNPHLFYVFNSDIITDYPLEEMLRMHLRHKKEGTICLTQVRDPSMFGVVLTRPADALITCFMEKPQEWVGDNINAGIYLFDRQMIARIESRPVSIEKEIFPAMAQAEQLYGYQHEGYWADIGKPRDFLDGTRLYLQALREAEESSEALDISTASTVPPLEDDSVLKTAKSSSLAAGPYILGNVLIHPSAQIGKGCLLGPNVTIDQNCKIGDGCRISNAAIMVDANVADYAKIDSAIIGWNSKISKWVRIDGLTVLGQDIAVAPELYINGAFVLPYKNITESIPESGKIIL